MDKSMDKLLVVCVDRDNDLGRKTKFQGPVIGRERNLKAASALALSDPAEADANTMFAAVRKYDELKKQFKNVEVVTLTGHGKRGFTSDRILNEQLDNVLEKYPASGFVLVTDGAEDDQVIPILQSRAKIISKEMVVIKQAQAVESIYFTIKEALKDPFLARIVFGIPGLILLLYFALGTYSFQIIAFVFGVYLLAKGFGIEDFLLSHFRSITESINVQRPSFPFYIGSFFIIAFGAITAYTNSINAVITDLLIDSVTIARSTFVFIALAAISVVVGRSIDVIHLRRAYMLRRYLLTGISVLLFWLILDTGTMVFLRMADLSLFLLSIVLSFVILLVAFRLSNVMDVKERITKLLVGLPVYNAEGMWLGKVEAVDKRKSSIVYTDLKSKKQQTVSKPEFSLREGRILLSG